MTGKRAHYVMVPEDDPQWVRFWDAYEKRSSKKDARKAWAELDPSPELVDRIVTALAWQFQQRDWMKNDRAYAPLPATYLRGERWTDERPGSRPPPVVESAQRCYYGHTPPCVTSSECRERYFREAREARHAAGKSA